MTARPVALVALALTLSSPPSRPQERHPDPFALFGAAGVLTAGDRRDLQAGRTVLRGLEESSRSHVGVFVAGRIDVSPAQFAARVRESAELWKGDAVPATGTFSTPGRPEDVAALALPPKDIQALRDCRPGDCLVKLSAPEMQRLRETLGRQGDVQAEFRKVVLDRVDAYRRGGVDALPTFHDHSEAVDPAAVFAALFAASDAVAAHEPELAAYLAKYPHAALPTGALEHMYWLSTNEPPRPTIQALHAVVLQRDRSDNGGAEVVVVSRQVFATHYVNGSFAITALLRDPAQPSVRYMVYLNRSAVDGLGGFLSGLKRFFVERRIRGAARSAFERLKQRIAA